jgi:hypothetical protein
LKNQKAACILSLTGVQKAGFILSLTEEPKKVAYILSLTEEPKGCLYPVPTGEQKGWLYPVPD